MRKLAPVVVATCLLAACSSSAAGGGSNSYASASDLANKIGCTHSTPDSGVMYEKDGLTCQIGSAQDVNVVIFADNTARDSWVKVAKTVAGAANIVEGDRWVVACPDMKTAATVKSITGGSDA